MKNLIYFTILSMFVFGSFGVMAFQTDGPPPKNAVICNSDLNIEVEQSSGNDSGDNKKKKVQIETNECVGANC